MEKTVMANPQGSQLRFALFLTAFAILTGAVVAAQAFSAFTLLLIAAELTFLVWAAWGEAPHRGDVVAFALMMNVQAAIRVTLLTAAAILVVGVAAAIPGVPAAALIVAVSPDGDLAKLPDAVIKIGIAISIALAAYRMHGARLRGISFHSMADGTYAKHSVRMDGTLDTINAKLDERLQLLQETGCSGFGARLSRFEAQVAEQHGRPLTRLYFRHFALRATISPRQIDDRHTDVRVFFRLRGVARVLYLFPNPLDVAILRACLTAHLLQPAKDALEGHHEVAELNPAMRASLNRAA